jgi:hypothetical protein
MKFNAAGWVVLGAVIAVGATYFVMKGGVSETLQKAADAARQLEAANVRIEELQQVISEKDASLLGYTEYTKYLIAGKQDLAAQAKLITATVRRNEGYVNYLKTVWMGLSSNGAVKVSYTAEYPFGYDLRSEKYEVLPSDNGIEIRIGRPILVATPAVTNMKHEVVSGGMFTNEAEAVIKLQQEAAGRVLAQGQEMARRDEIAALCERQLITTLRDFLMKQPGVKVVPQITVTYKET